MPSAFLGETVEWDVLLLLAFAATFLAMFDLPSVAQTNISVVGCVADATGVYGWLVDAGLWGGGRRWISCFL
jgi:hypothetical protein